MPKAFNVSRNTSVQQAVLDLVAAEGFPEGKKPVAVVLQAFTSRKYIPADRPKSVLVRGKRIRVVYRDWVDESKPQT